MNDYFKAGTAFKTILAEGANDINLHKSYFDTLALSSAYSSLLSSNLNKGYSTLFTSTKAADLVISGITDSELASIKNDYFEIKSYEKTERIDSKDMYSGWLRGDLKGPLYTDWVSSYIRVWDAIK